MVAFTWQDRLATFGDDSASYLTVAHYFSPWGDPAVSRWAGWHSNFPPLLSLALALTGGVSNLHVAFALVALFGAVGVFLFQRYAALSLGERGGFVVALLFLLTATAWISLKGVLSESLFLAISMGALLHFETRLAGRRAGALDWIVFGVLLALACLTRTIGVVLIAAYAAQLAVRFVKTREKPSPLEFLPILPVIALLGIWYAIRPMVDVDNYQRLAGSVISWWREDPQEMFAVAPQIMFAGWIRSFMADHDVSVTAKLAFAAVGILAISGAVLRAWRNRIDGWFVLFTLVIVFFWTFGPDASRRLLYPLVPLAILCAAIALQFLFDAAKLAGRARRLAAITATALPVVLTLPALAMIALKSTDVRPVLAGCPHTYREVSDYYGIVNQEGAEQVAAVQVTVLCGLAKLDEITPGGSTIMWVRPEYIALLGRREAVPYFYRWTPRELATEIRRSKTDYVIVSAFYKNDLAGGKGRAIKDMGLEDYSQPVLKLNDIFVVRKVDRTALARILR